jgi:hypothetical protein
VLEALDPLTQRGLLHSQPFRCSRDVLFLRNRDEAPEVGEIHFILISIWIPVERYNCFGSGASAIPVDKPQTNNVSQTASATLMNSEAKSFSLAKEHIK